MKFIEVKKNLKEKTLVQKIIAEIKEALIKEELHPGEKLPSEDQLCEKFSVSRVSVREAIKMLTALGVVTVIPGNGTYISKGPSSSLLDSLVFRLILQDKTSTELAELRKMLEIGILEVAMEKATSEDTKKMEEAIQSFQKAYSQGITDSEILSKYDLDFHFAFADAAHNPLITEIARAIYQLYISSIFRILYKDETVEESLEYHKMILKGIKTKDIQKTREVIGVASKRWKELSSKIPKNVENRSKA